MRHAAWARRAGSFATRLVLAVLLTALVTAALQSVLATRITVDAVHRAALSRVQEITAAHESGGGRTDDTADPLGDRAVFSARVARLATEHGVVTAALVEAPEGGRTTVVPAEVAGRAVLVVTAPVRLRSGVAGLRVALEEDEVLPRSSAMRRGLLLVIGLGAIVSVPLMLLLGGRRLLRRHHEEVRLSGTDDLTGAGSRRAFPVDLQATVGTVRDEEQGLSVLLAEIDGLDAVTGALGRRRADALLTEVADLLTDRHPHRVYRLGGEVFAVVLPRISAEDAFLLADALRSDVADRLPPLSMTIGVAGLDERCTDAETLLIAADAALDEARALGGNRVVGPGDATFGLRWVANRPGN